MRVGIVNDAVVASEVLRRVTEDRGRHTVAWAANDGAEALARCAHDTPDLILMDLLMPVMDGVEATRRIMAQYPCAILVVTASVNRNVSMVIEALGAGAIDAVRTPVLDGHLDFGEADTLLRKISLISHRLGTDRAVEPRKLEIRRPGRGTQEQHLLCVAASSGGPTALAQLLGDLPRDFPAAVIVIQHIDAYFSKGLAEWLDEQVALAVRVARHGDEPQAGSVLLAGGDDHLILTAKGMLAYTSEPRDIPYRPSIDVFLRSVAERWAGPSTGVILTGMGRDGARGLLAMRRAGSHTIAQDQESCAVYGMPKAARDLDAAERILPLECIASEVTKLCSSRTTTNGGLSRD